jgi:uncharacterized membrane protein
MIQHMLSSREDRARSNEEAVVQFYSNERTETLVKAIIGLATIVLLVLPTVILYVLTVHGATGGIKIGVLSIFVVALAVALATLTRASWHEMFGASAR